MSTSDNTPENSETSHANTDNAAARTNEHIVFGSYTGHIDGPQQAQRLVYEAPPQTRDGQPTSSEASVVSIIKTSVGSMDNSCYLLAVDNDAVLIDAATDAPFLLDLADAAGVKITDVITTHSHYDHVGALQEVLQQTGARHHASAGEKRIASENVNGRFNTERRLRVKGYGQALTSVAMESNAGQVKAS